MRLAQIVLILLVSVAVGGAFAQDGNVHGPPDKPAKATKAPQPARPAAPAKVPDIVKPRIPSH